MDPEVYVREGFQIELSAQFAIDSRQHVLVERRGYSLRVVVGGMKNGRVFLQIKADQERIAVAKRATQLGEELHRFFRFEIAYGGAQEKRQLAARERLKLRESM